jgi:hypothetical protein
MTKARDKKTVVVDVGGYSLSRTRRHTTAEGNRKAGLLNRYADRVVTRR